MDIGLIGGGNMGEALVRGLIQAGIVSSNHLHVYDVLEKRMEHLARSYGIHQKPSLSECVRAVDTVILAVKPQNVPEVLEELGRCAQHRPLIVSIVAGMPLATLEAALPPGTPVIRVMPNTPALVLSGASALARGRYAENNHMEWALKIFRAVGIAHEVPEKLLDAVTGLTGSGPAYVLCFLEALIDGGVLMGLPRPIASDLVIQTVLGTAIMAQQSGKHPAALKDMVTSPGGTTIHGLEILESRGFRGAVMGAVRAATERSTALGAVYGTPKSNTWTKA
ncbi:MAG: pyrroline-5-carboxylate reductase [Desulfosoma sp.]